MKEQYQSVSKKRYFDLGLPPTQINLS